MKRGRCQYPAVKIQGADAYTVLLGPVGLEAGVTCHCQGPHSWRWPKPEFEARTFRGFLFVCLFSLGGEASGSEGGTTRDDHLSQRRGPRGFPPGLPAGRTSGPRARAPEAPPARREPPSKRRRDWASGGGPGRVRGVGYVARRAGAWKRPGAWWGEWNGRWRPGGWRPDTARSQRAGSTLGAPRRGVGPGSGALRSPSEAHRWFCAVVRAVRALFYKARLQSVAQILCSNPCVERFGVPGSLP